MKHLALITTSFPLASDGSEAAGSFVVDLARELAQLTKVTVIAPGSQNEQETVENNLTIQRFTAPRQPLSLLKICNPLHWVSILKVLNSGSTAVQQVVTRSEVDHVLALWVLPSGYWARKVTKQHNVPYSTWALGSDIWSLGKIPLVKNVLQGVLKGSCINFADGFQLKDAVAKLSGRKCDFLPSTRKLHIPRKKSLSKNPPYRLAFLGRWHRNKGIDLLLDSLFRLHDYDWRRIEGVRICGGGPMEEQVSSGISKLKKQNYPVDGQGYLNKNEAVELLLWADYVLIPSRIESIPVIYSDAMKCKCPVVCMPVGDLPRLIQKYQSGILAKEVSGHGFSTAISQILQQSPQSFAVGLEQATYEFNLEYIVKSLLTKLKNFT